MAVIVRARQRGASQRPADVMVLVCGAFGGRAVGLIGGDFGTEFSVTVTGNEHSDTPTRLATAQPHSSLTQTRSPSTEAVAMVVVHSFMVWCGVGVGEVTALRAKLTALRGRYRAVLGSSNARAREIRGLLERDVGSSVHAYSHSSVVAMSGYLSNPAATLWQGTHRPISKSTLFRMYKTAMFSRSSITAHLFDT
jgi:hypothetical protein